MILNQKHVRELFSYTVSAVGFIHTHIYMPYLFHMDTKLNKNIIQDSVETTNKMQPCNRIYNSTVH